MKQSFKYCSISLHETYREETNIVTGIKTPEQRKFIYTFETRMNEKCKQYVT